MVSIVNSAFGNQNFSGAATLTISGFVHPGGPLVVFTCARSSLASGVTANGVAMIERGSTSAFTAASTQGWTLDDIPAFTGDIVITWVSGSVFHGVAHVHSLAGATETPFGVAQKAQGSTDTPTITVASAVGNLVIAGIINLDTAITHTAGGDQTKIREDISTGGGDPTVRFRIVTVTQPGDTSVVMDATLSAPVVWANVGFDVAAAEEEEEWPQTSVEVEPALISLVVNQTTTFVAKSYDDQHNVIPDSHTWESSDEGVATVHPTSGLVTAIAEGIATITATSDDASLESSGEVRVVETVLSSGGRRKGHQSPFTFARRRRR